MLPEGGGTVTMQYAPAVTSRYAMYLLPVAVAASLLFMYAFRLPADRPGLWAIRNRWNRRMGLLLARRPRLRPMLRPVLRKLWRRSR